MGTKRHKPEEIVAQLRQVDVLVSQGRSVADAIRSIGVTEVVYGTNSWTARSSPHWKEAQIVIESWRRHSNSVRPHASLGDRPPAPELFVPAFAAWPAALTRPAPPARLPRVQRLTVH
jgi:transposase InsO family protein